MSERQFILESRKMRSEFSPKSLPDIYSPEFRKFLEILKDEPLTPESYKMVVHDNMALQIDFQDAWNYDVEIMMDPGNECIVIDHYHLQFRVPFEVGGGFWTNEKALRAIRTAMTSLVTEPDHELMAERVLNLPRSCRDDLWSSRVSFFFPNKNVKAEMDFGWDQLFEVGDTLPGSDLEVTGVDKTNREYLINNQHHWDWATVHHRYPIEGSRVIFWDDEFRLKIREVKGPKKSGFYLILANGDEVNLHNVIGIAHWGPEEKMKKISGVVV